MKLFKNLYSRLSLVTSITLITGYVLVYAWTTLVPGDAATGQPLNQNLMQGIVNNINELNTNLTSITGKIWTLTNGKWCTTNGSTISCTSDAPTIGGTNLWSTGANSSINYMTGNVGIGNTTPSASLDVKRTTADTNFAGYIEGTDTANYGLGVNIANTTSSKAIVDFKSGNTSRLFVRADGNVGIGTVSPNSQLSVGGSGPLGVAIYGYNTAASGVAVYGEGHGNAASAGGYFTNTNGGYALLTGAGNVGIGTTSPGAKLEVNGDIKVAGWITWANFGQSFSSVMPDDMSYNPGGYSLGSATAAMPIWVYYYQVYWCAWQNNFSGWAAGNIVFSSGNGAATDTSYFDNTGVGGGSCGFFRSGFVQITTANSMVRLRIAGAWGNTDLNLTANAMNASFFRIF